MIKTAFKSVMRGVIGLFTGVIVNICMFIFLQLLSIAALLWIR